MAREKQIYNEGKSKRIKEARINAGMSRQQLANALVKLSSINEEYRNISGSISSVKSWEGIGRKYSPDNTTLKAIAEVLNVEFEWLLHGTVQDIIEESQKILKGFSPNSWKRIDFDNSIFYYDGRPLPNEIVSELCYLYPLTKSGYSINDIEDRKQFREYMASSSKNAIDFYINNLNKKKGR